MNRIFASLLLLATIAACQDSATETKAAAQQKALDTANFTTVKWIDSLKDIGTVEAGKTVEVKFRFSNSGDKPLMIIKTQPGCGCTLADYPKEPIMPGKEGLITANYEVAKDGHGEFRKNIKVTTNTKGNTDTYIFFYGNIKNDQVKEPQESNSKQQ